MDLILWLSCFLQTGHSYRVSCMQVPLGALFLQHLTKTKNELRLGDMHFTFGK